MHPPPAAVHQNVQRKALKNIHMHATRNLHELGSQLSIEIKSWIPKAEVSNKRDPPNLII